MNAPSKIGQAKTTVFRLNRSQAVRIPKELAFPEGVKRLIVRKVGNTLVLEPENSSWNDFFDRPPCPDFPDRGPQGDYEVREDF